jgi:predicted PurR-regulated permease PerM
MMTRFDFSISKAAERRVFLALIWLAIVLILIFVREILLPFVLAGFLAFVLDPIVRRISSYHIGKRPIPRGVAVLLVYAAFVGILAALIVFVLPEVYRELIRLTKIAATALTALDEDTIRSIANEMESFARRYNLPVEFFMPGKGGTEAIEFGHVIRIDLVASLKELSNDLLVYLKSQSMDIVDQLRNVLAGITSFLVHLLLILMLTAFILIDTKRIKDALLYLSFAESRKQFGQFLDRVEAGLSGVVRGQLLICLVNGVLTLIGLLLLKVKFAFILATLAGTLSLIPIFGSILSTVPITIVALSNSPLTGLLALAWIGGIHLLEANFLNPKIMGNAAKIHPVLVVFSLIAGEHFFGLVGALLAVPITSIIVTIFKSFLTKVHGQGQDANSAAGQ